MLQLVTNKHLPLANPRRIAVLLTGRLSLVARHMSRFTPLLCCRRGAQHLHHLARHGRFYQQVNVSLPTVTLQP
jgi:hypothetical protein